jgi:hypothetical protein
MTTYIPWQSSVKTALCAARLECCSGSKETRKEIMTKANRVWVLTSEYNDYDQHGEYFLAVWSKKPTHKDLMHYGVDQNRIEHVLNGGGRIIEGVNWDYRWWYLRELPTEEIED